VWPDMTNLKMMSMLLTLLFNCPAIFLGLGDFGHSVYASCFIFLSSSSSVALTRLSGPHSRLHYF
jgi:hypothetical protein